MNVIQAELYQAAIDMAENEPNDGHFWLKNSHYYMLLKAVAAYNYSLIPELSKEESKFWERTMWFRLFCMA